MLLGIRLAGIFVRGHERRTGYFLLNIELWCLLGVNSIDGRGHELREVEQLQVARRRVLFRVEELFELEFDDSESLAGPSGPGIGSCELFRKLS